MLKPSIQPGLGKSLGANSERYHLSSVMASVARPSIFEVRGDGLPRYARSDENTLHSMRADESADVWPAAV
jgi:hypothetical protein